MNKLIPFCLEKRYFILVLIVILAGIGIASWMSLKIEAYPDVSDTEVTIIAKYNGRPAEEVEQLVTIPLERAVNSVPNVIQRRSRTIFGLSVIKLTFETDVGDYFARARVLEKLKDAKLPEGVEVELGPLTSPVGEIMRYVITANEKYSIMELRELQDWVVTPMLMQAKGLADVTNFGGLIRQYNVIIKPVLLEKYKLSISNISEAIIANNSSTGGNIINYGTSQLSIRGVGRITNASDIERIVIAHQTGTPVYVRDVASVEIGSLPLRVY